ncbi:MAG: LapA family protein [Cypionkella sp.]
MMRYLQFVLIGAFGIALLLVAMANRAVVTVNLLPPDLAAFLGLTWAMELPLFLVIFGGLASGLLVGFVWEWLREHKHRRVASTKTREVSKLERELAIMRDTHSLPQDDVLALLDQPKPR